MFVFGLQYKNKVYRIKSRGQRQSDTTQLFHYIEENPLWYNVIENEKKKAPTAWTI